MRHTTSVGPLREQQPQAWQRDCVTLPAVILHRHMLVRRRICSHKQNSTSWCSLLFVSGHCIPVHYCVRVILSIQSFSFSTLNCITVPFVMGSNLPCTFPPLIPLDKSCLSVMTSRC